MNTILIVEDDSEIREAIQDALTLENYNVATANNGKEALEWLRINAKPQLILLDLMMPVMDGKEFLSELRKTYPTFDRPVVVLSAAGEKNVPTGATDFVRKPIDLEDLLSVASQYSQTTG